MSLYDEQKEGWFSIILVVGIIVTIFALYIFGLVIHLQRVETSDNIKISQSL